MWLESVIRLELIRPFKDDALPPADEPVMLLLAPFSDAKPARTDARKSSEGRNFTLLFLQNNCHHNLWKTLQRRSYLLIEKNRLTFWGKYY